MGDVIGQRYEVYEYEKAKDHILKKGEKIVVKGTPDFGESLVELMSPDKTRTVADLYAGWKDGVGSPFRTSIAQDEKDEETLAQSKEYTDNSLLAKLEWLPPVNTVADLPLIGLNNKQNYLCGVVADPIQSGVYQAVQGWETEPVWKLFNDYVDFVNEQELSSAINAHNEDGEAHKDIREAVASETEARATADSSLQQTIDREAQTNNEAHRDISAEIAANYLVTNEKIKETNDTLDGVQTLSLTGALLTRIVNGVTEVQKIGFPPDTVFVANKTLINDMDGTIGVYIEDVDSATIIVKTVTIAPVGMGESINLGVVATHADLPPSVELAKEMFSRNPNINDYASVKADETFFGKRVEWYITNILGGVITWGNPVPINMGDYQEQSPASMAGKLLKGGVGDGTFGEPIPVDVEVTNNGVGIPTSKAVFDAIEKGVVSNTTYENLTSLIASSGLKTGAYYKITDYQTIYKQPVTEIVMSGSTEPMIVRASSSNTLDVKAFSPSYPLDEIWYNVKNNNTNEYGWATPTDKGQIYRRITKNKNDIPYDVRAVKFRRWALDTSAVPAWSSSTNYSSGSLVKYQSVIYVCAGTTSGAWDSSRWVKIYDEGGSPIRFASPTDLVDYKFIGNTEITLPVLKTVYNDFHTFTNSSNNMVDAVNVNNNEINSYAPYGKQQLNNNVFFSFDLQGTYGNKIDANSHDNTIWCDFNSNTIGSNFNFNLINADFCGNVIGHYFWHNTVGIGFNGNGTNCSKNAHYSHNIIGDYFKDNTVDSMNNCTIGNNFQENVVQKSFSNNTIAAYFINNTFGSRFYNQNMSGYSASSSNQLRYNDFKNGFTTAKTWGTSQSALLLSDHSVTLAQIAGSATVAYHYHAAAALTTGSF